MKHVDQVLGKMEAMLRTSDECVILHGEEANGEGILGRAIKEFEQMNPTQEVVGVFMAVRNK